MTALEPYGRVARVAEVFVGRASTTHWINPDLGIVKVPTDLAAPIMIKGSITYVEGFTAVGELEKTLNSYHFRASKLSARPSLPILSEKSEKCFGYIGDYTTQVYGDYIKPLYGSLLNNQCFMEIEDVGRFSSSLARWTRAWSPTTLSWTSWANISTNGSF